MALRSVPVLFAALLALLPMPSRALDQKALDAYAREIWTTRDGLPHNQVNSIAQTPEGYLWFATWEGVVRYNGQEFRSFGRNNVPALQDSGIRAVSVGPTGNLVVATSRGGVTRLAPDGAKVFTVGTGLGSGSDVGYGVLEDGSGAIWAATGLGVARIEGDRGQNF